MHEFSHSAWFPEFICRLAPVLLDFSACFCGHLSCPSLKRFLTGIVLVARQYWILVVSQVNPLSGGELSGEQGGRSVAAVKMSQDPRGQGPTHEGLQKQGAATRRVIRVCYVKFPNNQ